MRISLKDLIEVANNNNKDWLETIQVKNRIKNIIKIENNLPVEVIDFLWQKRELRYDLTSYQHLSDDKLTFIIENYSNPRESSRIMFTQMLRKQDLSDTKINEIKAHCTLNEKINQWIETWRIIPDRLESLYGFVEYLNMFHDNIYNSNYQNTLVYICKKPGYLKQLLDYIQQNSLLFYLTSTELLKSLCCGVFFTDSCIDKLMELLSPEELNAYSSFIVSKENCSKASKTMLLLYK